MKENAFGMALGKYREIVVAVAFFLVFDMGVLILNFYTSYQIAEDAVAINLAGRQRMLSQRMTKSLLLLQADMSSESPPASIKAIRDELATTSSLFDGTLKSFQTGGQATGAAGTPVHLNRVETERGQAVLSDAATLWSGYYSAMQQVLKNPAPSAEEMATAVLYARANNVKLLGLMNDLTNELENVASRKSAWLRIVQTVGIVLAMLNFVFILFKFIRKLRESDRQTELAQKETQEILGTVKEGLFLLDPEFKFGGQHSHSMKEILHRDITPGTEFLPLLRNMVSETVFESACGYIELLFGNRVKEGLVASLNPLSEVEVRLQDANGELVTRYLAFQFNRVVEDKKVPHLLVTVQDVTERVMLVRQLNAAKSEARVEVDVLLRMLSTEPDVLRGFLGSMEGSLNQVNDILRYAGERGMEYQHVIAQTLRIIHACKGEAGVLGLEMLESQAHDFERELVELRERGQLTGDDMVALSVSLNALYERVYMVRDITERIAGMSETKPSSNQTAWDAARDSLRDGLAGLASRIATQQNKQVTVNADFAALQHIEPAVAAELRQIAIQLMRNAVTHGIEVPDERIGQAKPEAGTIYVAIEKESDGYFRFVMRDDGRGLSPARIRASLLDAGLMSAEAVDKMNDRDLIMQIFSPGFTTVKDADEHAGHGVGMDVILAKVKAIGGKLHLNSRPNEFTEFSIRFPAFSA